MACAPALRAAADTSRANRRDFVSKGAAARRAARGVIGDIAVFSSLSLEEGFGRDLSLSRGRVERGALRGEERVEARAREREKLIHLFAREWLALGRALKLYETAVARADDVHVHGGARVLVVLEVEERHAPDYADADRGHFARDRERLEPIFLHEAAAGKHERDVRARNRGRAGAAVGLQNVAVYRDGALAESREVRDGAQAAADESLYLVRAPRRAAPPRLALRALL